MTVHFANDKIVVYDKGMPLSERDIDTRKAAPFYNVDEINGKCRHKNMPLSELQQRHIGDIYVPADAASGGGYYENRIHCPCNRDISVRVTPVFGGSGLRV
jgi:hypothetical protein